MRKVTWDNARGLCSMKEVHPCMVLSVTAFLEGIHGLSHVQTLLKLCCGDLAGVVQNRARVS